MKRQQALCCICGTLRTCSRPRNHRQENFWLSRPIDPKWHRETGDLKCETCGEITVHAIILPAGDAFRNHAEELHRVATGWAKPQVSDEYRRRIQERWRQGLPANPELHHIWWCSDEEDAREAGSTHFPAVCRVMIPLPERDPDDRDTSLSGDELVAPRDYIDVDREDVETGLWWYDVDCVDCLALSNAVAVNRQRNRLKLKLIELAQQADSLAPGEVSLILSRFVDADQSHGGG